MAGIDGDGGGRGGVAKGERAAGALGDFVFVGIVEAQCADSVVAVECDDSRGIGERQRAEEIGGSGWRVGDAAFPVGGIVPRTAAVFDPLRRIVVETAGGDDFAGEAEGAVAGLY